MAGLLIFQGCKDRPEFATRLYKKFNNKVFRDLDTAGYNPMFRKVLQQKQKNLKYPQIISKYYKSKNYEPLFISKFLPEDEVQLVLDHFSKAGEHGLNPELFNYTELKEMTDKFYDQKSIKTTDEAYQAMANLEIELAESLLFYSNTLGYGLTDPHKLFKEYYMGILYPDSVSMAKVFAISNLKNYLDSIQPHNPEYLILQKGLKTNFIYTGLSLPDTRKTIELNLERLRWKNKPTTNR
ncbi:MAG: L,D-transpeptidase, partial [Daejeonella sp.]